MQAPKFFEEIASKLNDVVANGPAKDIEKNARALLAQGFSKLDLVSREEFELLNLRLEKLEARLAALETPTQTTVRPEPVEG